jgi:hypothetical protein
MKKFLVAAILFSSSIFGAANFPTGVTYDTNIVGGARAILQTGLKVTDFTGSVTNMGVNGEINPKNATYGAVGNLGAEDDSAATQLAATAAKNKRLHFTKGIYKISNINLEDGTEVIVDAGASFIDNGPTSVSYFFKADGKTNITLRGINGNGGAAVTGLLFLNNCTNISIYDSYGVNFATNTTSPALGGAGIVSAVNCTYITVDNCQVNGSGYGVNFEDTTKSTVTNSKIKNSYRDGILFYHGANNNRADNNYVEGYSSGTQSGRGGIQVYGSWNAIVTGNTVVDGYPSNPQDTGGIRFRDAPNFVCVGNFVTNAPSGILCNQANDFPGLMTYGVISGNTVDRSVYSNIHVAGNCGYVSVSDNITPNANTAASASVASITINSPYALVSGNIISNNIGNAWGIYGGSTGLLIANNKLINVGNGGGSTPQIAAFGTNIGLFGNHFTDDRATSIGYLGIRIYTSCSATIGDQFYGNGITNYIEVSTNGIYMAGSAPYPNRFATTPSTGTYQAGALSRGSGGRMFRSNGSGWSEDVFMDSIYPNNSTINFYSSTAVATGLIGLSSANNASISAPLEGGAVIAYSPTSKVQLIASTNYWYLYPNGDMRSGVVAAPTTTTSALEGGLVRRTNVNGKVQLLATYPTLPYSVLGTEGVGDAFATNAYSSSWATNYQQGASQSNIYAKIESIVLAAAGTNATFVNGSAITTPNFKNSATTNSPQITFNLDTGTNVIAQLNAFGAQTDMTIASDALAAPTSTVVRVLPESSTSDDLATVAAPATTGISFFYMLRRAGDAITIKHGTGNILCPGNVDAILGGNEDGTPALFLWNTVLGKWVVSVANSQSIAVTDQGTGVKVIQPTTSSFSRNSGVTQRAITNRNLITLTSDSINGIRIGANIQVNGADLSGLNLIDSPTASIGNSGTNYQVNITSPAGTIATVTMVSDGITLPNSPTNFIKLTPETGTADNLSYISPPASGTRSLVIRPSGTNAITIKHGVTNIACMNQADILLSGSGAVAYLVYDTGTTNWIALSDLNTGGTSGGGSAPVGTMVNSGASTAFYIPEYADTTGTNVVPGIWGYSYNTATNTPANGTNFNFNGRVNFNQSFQVAGTANGAYIYNLTNGVLTGGTATFTDVNSDG